MKRLLLLPLLLFVLGSGDNSATNAAPFVANAASLAPSVAVASPAAPLIEERVIRQSAPVAPVSQPAAVSGPSSDLGSSVGMVIPGNNCVACVKAMTGRSQNGNAGTWKSSHSNPQVGDIMIWRPGQQGASSAGHVGVVVGVHGNKVSIKHCNWPGQTEFQSTGLFW